MSAGELVTCTAPGCSARFFFVAARQYPGLCLDHSDDRDREEHGWSPENSVD